MTQIIQRDTTKTIDDYNQNTPPIRLKVRPKDLSEIAGTELSIHDSFYYYDSDQLESKDDHSKKFYGYEYFVNQIKSYFYFGDKN